MNFRDSVSSLGKPAYADDDVALFHGDCVELLGSLPPSSVALTVTSPPYNIGKEYEDVLPLPEYISWTKRWTSLVHQATAEDGAFWLNLGYVSVPNRGKAVPLPYLLWDATSFQLMQEVVWNYGAGVSAKRFFSPRNEKFLWYVKDSERYTFNLDAVRDPNVKYPNQKKGGRLRCNPLGKNPSDVWQIPKVTSGKNRSSAERTDHPAQFPMKAIERIVLACSNETQIVLDPFAGSGTSLEVALLTGRKAIGFELNSRYIEIASKRLRDARGRGGRPKLARSPRIKRDQLPARDLFGN